MKPEEYLVFVIKIFENQGFKIQMITASYDLGIDFVAFNRNLKIAVKSVLRSKQKVDHQDVMLVYAGKSIFECNEAYLITTSDITGEAKEVAEKLNVQVMGNFMPDEKYEQPVEKKKKGPETK